MPREPRTLPKGYELGADGIARRITANSKSPPERVPFLSPSLIHELSTGKKLGRKIRQPNQTEKEAILILRSRHAGAGVFYEPLTFLCDAVKYTPDVMVCESGFAPMFYEVKGPFKRKQDIIRLKVAAAQYPFRFVLLEKLADGWRDTVIRGKFDR